MGRLHDEIKQILLDLSSIEKFKGEAVQKLFSLENTLEKELEEIANVLSERIDKAVKQEVDIALEKFKIECMAEIEKMKAAIVKAAQKLEE